MQMQETARHSLLGYSPGGGGSSLYGREGLASEDSGAPMLQPPTAKGSGLRYYVADDGSQIDENRSDEDLIVRRREMDGNRF